MKKLLYPLLLACLGLTSTAHADEGESAKFTPKQFADALHLVMSSDRTVYTRLIVNRLQNKEKVIKASEHFEDDAA